jgi:hypothetical protein
VPQRIFVWTRNSTWHTWYASEFVEKPHACR